MPTSQPSPTRILLDRMELENWLGDRLQAAYAIWRDALQHANAPSPDGHLARSQAVRAYERYADALGVFCGLVVDGRMPPESLLAEWRASRGTQP